MTARFNARVAVLLVSALLTVVSFTYLVSDQCGSRSLHAFVSDSAAWFTAEGC